MVTLDEVKLFLRVDNDEEDMLLSSLIITSKELVEGVIRQPISVFEVLPETLRQACLFAVATMYEERQCGKNGLDTKGLLDTLKLMLFRYRKESF